MRTDHMPPDATTPRSAGALRACLTGKCFRTMMVPRRSIGSESTSRTNMVQVPRSGALIPFRNVAVRGTSVCGPEWAAPQETPVVRGNVQQPTSVPVATGKGQASDNGQGLHRSEYRHLVTLVLSGWFKGWMGGDGSGFRVTLG